MTTPRWIDTKLSIGNIITILIVVVGVVAGWYAKDAAIAANRADIVSVQKDMTRAVMRIDNIESYQNDTTDRLARIEEQTRSLNEGMNRLLDKLDNMYEE